MGLPIFLTRPKPRMAGFDWKRLFRRQPRAQLTPELRARIQASFDAASRDEEHFPSTIDPRIST